MEKLHLLLLGLILSACLCDGYRILAVFPTPSPSHGILGDNIVKHLLNAGHEVSTLGPIFYLIPNRLFNIFFIYFIISIIISLPLLGTGLFSHREGMSIDHHACSRRIGDFRLLGPGLLTMFSFTVVYISPYQKMAHPKLEVVDVSQNTMIFSDKKIDVKQIMEGKLNLQDQQLMFGITATLTNATLSYPNVQKLLKDPKQKFDVIISEYFFNDIYSALSAVYDAPFIWFVTIVPHSLILNQIHGPLNPSYGSDYLEARVAPYPFIERVRELYRTLTSLFNLNIAFHGFEETIYENNIASTLKALGKPVPDYTALKYNVSMVLGNSQVALESALPLPPNFKHIGGFHIDEELTPLPENLKKILDNSKNGVVYFSMGSNLRSKDLPDDLKQGLLRVLGGLKQTVIWKFEENLPNMPKNVHIVQWAPQQSVLAHPNVVLFVTHGGLLSVTEAVHFGVPLVVIPVFGDQFLNANLAVKKGIAVQIKLSYTMYKDLEVALDKVLNDKKYAANAKDLSVAYHDLPMKPKDALAFWVQHVVRTRGAPHLRSVALQIPLYQRLYLDLLALILLIPVVLLLVFKKYCSNKTNVSKKIKTN